MTMTMRALRRMACTAAILGLVGVLPAGAAVAAPSPAAAPRAVSGIVHPAGNPWIYIGTYQYLSDCVRIGESYHRQSYRCDRDAPFYTLYVYYV